MHIDHCVPGIFCGLTLSRFISVLVSISSIKFKKIVSTLFFEKCIRYIETPIIEICLSLKTIIGSPAKRCLMTFRWRADNGHWNGVSLAGRWWPKFACWLGSFVIFQGIRTITYKEPYIFVIVQGVGVRTPVPFYGSAHELYIYIKRKHKYKVYFGNSVTFLYFHNGRRL